MNRSDLIRAIAKADGVDLATAERMLQTLTDTIELSLACGEAVTIRNFGKFEVRDRNPVVRLNPRTGDKIEVPAKQSVLFHAAPALKRRVNKNGETVPTAD